MRQLADRLDYIIVFGDGHCHARDIDFLKRIAPELLKRDVPGNGNQRRRIHIRIGDAGDKIRRAGAAGRKHNTDPAGRTRVAVCGMTGKLLMATCNKAHRAVASQRVIHRQHAAARIAEHRIDPLLLQAGNKNFRTVQYRQPPSFRQFRICAARLVLRSNADSMPPVFRQAAPLTTIIAQPACEINKKRKQSPKGHHACRSQEKASCGLPCRTYLRQDNKVPLSIENGTLC